MHAAEVLAELPAFFYRSIIALLLGILHHPDVLLRGATATNVLKAMAQCCAKSLEDRGKEQTLAAGEAGWCDINDFVVADRHKERDGTVKG